MSLQSMAAHMAHLFFSLWRHCHIRVTVLVPWFVPAHLRDMFCSCHRLSKICTQDKGRGNTHLILCSNRTWRMCTPKQKYRWHDTESWIKQYTTLSSVLGNQSKHVHWVCSLTGNSDFKSAVSEISEKSQFVLLSKEGKVLISRYWG